METVQTVTITSQIQGHLCYYHCTRAVLANTQLPSQSRTPTHPHTHACMHAQTHTHTHTHIHSLNMLWFLSLFFRTGKTKRYLWPLADCFCQYIMILTGKIPEIACYCKPGYCVLIPIQTITRLFKVQGQGWGGKAIFSVLKYTWASLIYGRGPQSQK